MPALLRQVDVVLNNSQSEGLSNALVEAAALGVPMLVRAIPGNSAVVTDGVNGLLYHDAPSFHCQARALCEDPARRCRLSQPEPLRYAPERETQALAALYAEVKAEIRQ
jgi:glycosyltransferase involved in cell wall biosynthesis